MRHRELVGLTRNYRSTIEFLMNRGYLRSEIRCQRCPTQIMKVYFKNERALFKCCRCTTTNSIFYKTIFQSCNKDISEILDVIYFWCMDQVQSITGFESGISNKNTISRWYSKLNELSGRIMRGLNPTGKIGGPGHVIQIDESKFSKRKFGVGRIVRSPWIVGMIDVETREVCFVETFFRNSETLNDIIHNHINEGSILITDCWAGYNNLQNLGFQHFTVNHSENFVDPITGANTQLIENTWGVYKKNMRKRGINYACNLNGYFFEFMFKKKFGRGAFEKILENIYLLE